MDLDELRTVRRQERETDSLQHLRDDFYEDVAAYIRNLKDERDEAAAAADDPFSSTEVRKLTDEIDTAEEVSEAIYEQRVGKIVKLASFAAADMTVDEGGMTRHERALFEDLVERIRANKATVLDVLAGETDTDDTPAGDAPAGDATASDTAVGDTTTPPPSTEATPPSPPGEEPGTPPSGVDPSSGETADPEPPADVLEEVMSSDATPESSEPDSEESAEKTPTTDGGAARSTSGSDGRRGTPGTVDGGDASATQTETQEDERTATTDDPTERTAVRITDDVGEIFGVDGREYHLQRQDVVTLPTVNAEPLVDRDAAEPIE